MRGAYAGPLLPLYPTLNENMKLGDVAAPWDHKDRQTDKQAKELPNQPRNLQNLLLISILDPSGAILPMTGSGLAIIICHFGQRDIRGKFCQGL